MKNKKNIILLIICILIVAIVICTIFIKQIKRNKHIEESKEFIAKEIPWIEPEETGDIFAKVNNKHDLYAIKNAINNFVSYIKQVNGDQYFNLDKLETSEAEIQKEGIDSIKAVLDKQYTSSIEVSDQGLVQIFGKYKQVGNYKENVAYNLNIKDMRLETVGKNMVKIAFVEAEIDGKDFNFLIKTDRKNEAYSIFLEDYITKYNYSANMKKEDIEISEERIEYNGYNKYTPMVATEEYVSIQLFTDFKNNLLNNPERAYNTLNKEYREKKYGSYEGFCQYIEENRQRLENIEIAQYQVVETNGKTKYVCLDQYGRYYIFVENGIMDYEAILDTYTIDLPEFLEKYENQSNQIKVGYNLQKIFNALHDEDYSYVYNKLDKTFRENNFQNEQNFAKYARENFLNKELKYSAFEEKDKICVADVKITDSDGNTTTRQFIMRIDEGTDFVMSFNVN